MDDLTGRLRVKFPPQAQHYGYRNTQKLMTEAADRIEELEDDLSDSIGWDDWQKLIDCIQGLIDRIEELEAMLQRITDVLDHMLEIGPADIGMVRVRMDRPATGETTQLWREATDE